MTETAVDMNVFETPCECSHRELDHRQFVPVGNGARLACIVCECPDYRPAR